MNPIIAANWKMNLTKSEVELFINKSNQIMASLTNIDLIIGPAFPYLNLVANQLLNGEVAAQNISEFKSGAFTGDVSAEMIKSCGVNTVILGHSERRHKFNETNDMIKNKLNLCETYNLKPILCVGETLEERKSGQLEHVIKTQLDVLTPFKHEYYIAYEPVWAIGTGETATPEIAEDVHAYIRNIIGNQPPILYGGSVNSKNIEGLLKMPNIDGALIGGASLKIDEFSEILSISNALERVSK